jgi:amino acid permease
MMILAIVSMIAVLLFK